MRKMDDSGQWLLLGAMLVAVGLAILIVFVNQSVLAGHSASESIMDFPKGDIRELRAETMNEAFLIGTNANANGSTLAERRLRFEDAFGQYISDVRRVFSARGSSVGITYLEGLNYSISPGGQSLDNVTLIMYYHNGDTKYNETSTVYLK